MSRRILVTGGAGFIGANFVHHWMARHPEDHVVVLDALTYAGNLASLEPCSARATFAFVHGDICDGDLLERVFADQRIDTVVHFAAESHVDRSIEGPDAFIRTNVTGTHELLKAARRAWAGATHPVRFHHVSTDEVYGSLGEHDAPFTEDHPYQPNSPYAASKAAADHLVRAYHHTYGLPVTTSNCSNNYGPYHFPEKLIPLAIVNALAGKPIPVYGDGKQVRDWLFVTDHCHGIEAVLERGTIGETYNVGGNCERTNLEVIRALCAALDAAFRADGTLAGRFPDCPAARGSSTATLVTHVTDRPGHDRRYAIDASRMRAQLGFSPRTGFDEGIRRTVDWFLGNEGWWRGVMDGSYRDWMRRQYSIPG